MEDIAFILSLVGLASVVLSYLMKGKNIIAVKTSDASKVMFDFPFQKISSVDKWCFSEKAENAWNKRDFNDRHWKFDIPAAKKTVYMRKAVFVEHSKLYPFITE